LRKKYVEGQLASSFLERRDNKVNRGKKGPRKDYVRKMLGGRCVSLLYASPPKKDSSLGRGSRTFKAGSLEIREGSPLSCGSQRRSTEKISRLEGIDYTKKRKGTKDWEEASGT